MLFKFQIFEKREVNIEHHHQKGDIQKLDKTDCYSSLFGVLCFWILFELFNKADRVFPDNSIQNKVYNTFIDMQVLTMVFVLSLQLAYVFQRLRVFIILWYNQPAGVYGSAEARKGARLWSDLILLNWFEEPKSKLNVIHDFIVL